MFLKTLHNSVVAANTTGQSLFLGELTTQTDIKREDQDLYTQKSSVTEPRGEVLNPWWVLFLLICCVSGEILVTPVLRHLA